MMYACNLNGFMSHVCMADGQYFLYANHSFLYKYTRMCGRVSCSYMHGISHTFVHTATDLVYEMHVCVCVCTPSKELTLVH